jgi:hypothetical protein
MVGMTSLIDLLHSEINKTQLKSATLIGLLISLVNAHIFSIKNIFKKNKNTKSEYVLHIFPHYSKNNSDQPIRTVGSKFGSMDRTTHLIDQLCSVIDETRSKSVTRSVNQLRSMHLLFFPLKK